MKIARVIILCLCALFLLSMLTGCNEYAKKVHDDMRIEHVYSSPTTAYGPGTIVMLEKKSGYTGVCKPEWVIADEKPKEDTIADRSVEKSHKIDFNIDLKAADIAKLQGAKVDAKYYTIDKVTLDFKNGKQHEVIPVFSEVWSRIKANNCAGNLISKRDSHPAGKFFLVQVAYSYDFNIALHNKSGATFDLDIPKKVLEVVALKTGISTETEDISTLSGKNLYIGFNGDPVDIVGSAPADDRVNVIHRLTGSLKTITADPLTAEKTKPAPVVDITEFVKQLK